MHPIFYGDKYIGTVYISNLLPEQGSERLMNVCAKHGISFEEPSYFDRLFKNAYGVSPKEYRKKYSK